MYIVSHRSVAMEVIILALAFTSGFSEAQQAQPSDECPASSPRFRVGHTIKSLNVKGTLGENRPIQVEIWYPARDQDDCDEAADFQQGPGGCHAPLAVYQSRIHGLPLLPQFAPLSWTTTALNAFEDARVARGDERFSAIIFSHGNGNNGFDHAYMLEALASNGYIVAAPDHLNNSQDDVRIDFVNSTAGHTVIPCLDGLAGPCSRPDVPKSMVDRFHDVQAVLDALPTWFGHRVDMDRVGIMGHSRGTVTSLSVAGGSTTWGFPPLLDTAGKPRIKALMGLSIGALQITLGVDLKNVTVPTLLVGGTLDKTGPLAVSQTAFNMISSTDKKLVTITNAVHRHFDSAYCAQMQSSGAIAQDNSAAVWDRQTVNQILWNRPAPLSGAAVDFCGFNSFATPTNIIPFVNFFYATATTAPPPAPPPLPGFTVTPSDVPTHGLTTDMVKGQVINLAVSFFGRVLNPADGDDRPFADCLPDEFKNQPPIPDPTQQDLDDSELHANDPD